MLPETIEWKNGAPRRCRKCGGAAVVKLTSAVNNKYTLVIDGDVAHVKHDGEYDQCKTYDITCTNPECHDTISGYPADQIEVAIQDWNEFHAVPTRKDRTLLEEIQRLIKVRDWDGLTIGINICMDRGETIYLSGNLAVLCTRVQIFSKDILSLHHWELISKDDKRSLIMNGSSLIRVYWYPDIPEID